ncbi:uncharacterized protein METZ01_LOCUS349782, partial [marine metagenome]
TRPALLYALFIWIVNYIWCYINK